MTEIDTNEATRIGNRFGVASDSQDRDEDTAVYLTISTPGLNASMFLTPTEAIALGEALLHHGERMS